MHTPCFYLSLSTFVVRPMHILFVCIMHILNMKENGARVSSASLLRLSMIKILWGPNDVYLRTLNCCNGWFIFGIRMPLIL